MNPEQMQEPIQPGSAPRGRTVEWLSKHIPELGSARGEKTDSRQRWATVALCVFVFLTAAGVRYLHWQDRHVEITHSKASLTGEFAGYEKAAARILDTGGILFPNQRPTDGDARLVVHPPGYSILLACLGRPPGSPSYNRIWALQIVCDSFSSVIVFLIAAQMFNLGVAVVAGELVALSPHFSLYSLFLTPDTLSILFILISVYFILVATRKQRPLYLVASGSSLGFACWLVANAMLIPCFFLMAIPLLFKSRSRLKASIALVLPAIAIIVPITIRNYVVFHRFIPISIQTGISLVEGIGDYDTQNRFGMPRSDLETLAKDGEWQSRSDYRSLWTPDGFERDQRRFAHGVAVVKSNPGWFLGVMLRRAGSMLRYNEGRPLPFPDNTSQVSPITPEPPFSHALKFEERSRPADEASRTICVFNGQELNAPIEMADGLRPMWAATSESVFAQGSILSPGARVTLAPFAFAAGTASGVAVDGDGSAYGDQFQSASIRVNKNTDYVLRIPVEVVSGEVALKVASADRRVALASAGLSAKEFHKSTFDQPSPQDAKSLFAVVQMPFATGARDEIRVVIGNNGGSVAHPSIVVGAPVILEAGRTSGVVFDCLRPGIRSVQRRVFVTARLVPLIGLGILVLVFARRFRDLAILLAIPANYLCLQSALHTEYRYILAMHYLLFIVAGVAICFVTRVLIWAVKGFLPALRAHSSSKPG